MPGVCVGTLKKVPLFADIDDAVLEQVCGSVRPLTLKAGELLFSQGDPGETLYLIESGRLKVYAQGPNEQEILLDIVSEGHVIGELALLDGKPRSASVLALEDSDLLALDREPFMAHLHQSAETAIRLLIHLAEMLRQRVLETETSSEINSQARLAHTLLFLAEREGRIEPGVVTSTLRKKTLAAATGASEEWVTQMLNDWCREGVIGMTGTRRLLLHDVDALRVLCGLEE